MCIFLKLVETMRSDEEARHVLEYVEKEVLTYSFQHQVSALIQADARTVLVMHILEQIWGARLI